MTPVVETPFDLHKTYADWSWHVDVGVNSPVACSILNTISYCPIDSPPVMSQRRPVGGQTAANVLNTHRHPPPPEDWFLRVPVKRALATTGPGAELFSYRRPDFAEAVTTRPHAGRTPRVPTANPHQRSKHSIRRPALMSNQTPPAPRTHPAKPPITPALHAPLTGTDSFEPSTVPRDTTQCEGERRSGENRSAGVDGNRTHQTSFQRSHRV